MKALKTEQQIAVVAAAAAALLLALTYFVVLAPLRSNEAGLKEQIGEVRGQLAAARSEAAQPPRTAPTANPPTGVSLANAIPDSLQMPNLLLQLNGVARETGVDFESISPSEPVAASGYQTVPLNAVFGGNFFEISDFLYRLRNLVAVRDGKLTTGGRLFDVSSIELKENPGTFPRLEASLTINAYVRGSSASAAPASSAGTSSTSGATASASGSTPASGGQR